MLKTDTHTMFDTDTQRVKGRYTHNMFQDRYTTCSRQTAAAAATDAAADAAADAAKQPHKYT